MSRLQMPTDAQLTPEQAVVCAEAKAGPRGKVPTPMIAWIRSPELARRAQGLGALLRFDTTIELHLLEMAILVCARHWTAHVQWKAHKALAINAGLDPKIIQDIAARRTPTLPDARSRVIYDVAHALMTTGRVPEALYATATAQLGERGLVELVGTLGYYCLVALTLNTFELGLPESVADDLQDPLYMAA